MAGITKEFDPDPQAIGARLLRHLQSEHACPSLAFRAPPAMMSLGLETWVYAFELEAAPEALSGPAVLRAFPADARDRQATFEATVQNHLASVGLPVPRVLLACEDPAPIGRPFLLMEHMPGQMQLIAALAGKKILRRAPELLAEALVRMPRQLADAQRCLHALDAAPLRARLEEVGLPSKMYTIDGRHGDVQTRIGSSGASDFEPLLEWLANHPPPEPGTPVICHGDFNPPNVLTSKGQITGIIDWSGATLAEPAWEVANSRMPLALNPFDVPRLFAPIVGAVRGRAAQAYFDAYCEASPSDVPLDRERLAWYEVLVAMRMLFRTVEDRRNDAHGRDGRRANPWLARGATRPLVRYLRKLTGLAIPIGLAEQ
jgi:aminoglycoside phosphotransferase (APT) family kinase protein